jgi:RNA polymerase sigma-70 factor, ECF subfamily
MMCGICRSLEKGALVSKRTNEEWIEHLQSTGPARDAALADLRQILVSGLQRGLLTQVNTAAPEFDTLTDDFVQEALLKILDKLDSFAGRSQFTTWAHKVALSVALTELRRKRWQDNSLDEMSEGHYLPGFASDPSPAPDTVTERADLLGRVNRIINEELTEKQHKALTAAVLEGKSTAEVAALLTMKPNAVYKLLHDARLRLKHRLANEGLSPGDIIAAFESG